MRNPKTILLAIIWVFECDELVSKYTLHVPTTFDSNEPSNYKRRLDHIGTLLLNEDTCPFVDKENLNKPRKAATKKGKSRSTSTDGAAKQSYKHQNPAATIINQLCLSTPMEGLNNSLNGLLSSVGKDPKLQSQTL